MKKLIITSIIFYINNLILLLYSGDMSFDNMAAFWIFSPIVLVLFTTNLLEQQVIHYSKKIRLLVVLDFFIRLILATIIFLYLSEVLSITGFIMWMLTILGYTVGSLIQYILFKSDEVNVDDARLNSKQLDYLSDDYATNQTILIGKNVEERKEIQRIYSATFYAGITKVLLVILLTLAFFAFGFVNENGRVFIFAIGFVITYVYLIFTNKKLQFGFDDATVIQKLLLRDNLTFVTGVAMMFILQGILYFDSGIFNVFGVCISALLFIPTIMTNRKISENFHQINKKYLDVKQ